MVRVLNLSFEDELNQNKFELLNALVNGKCTCVRHLQEIFTRMNYFKKLYKSNIKFSCKKLGF